MSFEHEDALRFGLRRVKITKVYDEGTQQFVDLSGLKDDKPAKVFRPQVHGFASNPPTDSEALAWALGGGSDRLIVLGGEHKDHKPKNVPAGGTVLYDAYGKAIKQVEAETTIDGGGKPVIVKNASTVKIEGNTDVAIGVNGRWVRIRPGRVDLGVESPTAEAPNKVMTEAGPSSFVYAKV